MILENDYCITSKVTTILWMTETRHKFKGYYVKNIK